jgi:ribonuclease D
VPRRKTAKKSFKNTVVNSLHGNTPISLANSQSDSENSPEWEHFSIHFEGLREKSRLAVQSPDERVSISFGALEERFPRDRFLALDLETTGLCPAADSVRTVQICDGENVAILVFDRPVSARALVVLADFLRGRRVVAHNARFEASWLHEAGIDLVLDDTVLMFAAVRGSRLPRGDKFIGGGGGRVSLAALAAMVLGETLDKSEQTSDWSAPELSPAQITYALNDVIVTHRIWEALRAELHRKSEQFGIDATGYEDMRFSAAMAHVMERNGISFASSSISCSGSVSNPIQVTSSGRRYWRGHGRRRPGDWRLDATISLRLSLLAVCALPSGSSLRRSTCGPRM